MTENAELQQQLMRKEAEITLQKNDHQMCVVTSVATYSLIMTTTSHDICMTSLKELPLCISRHNKILIVPYLMHRAITYMTPTAL